MTTFHHESSVKRTAPRPGTKRRALWDLLHAAPNTWIEFDGRDYAPNAAALAKVAAAFRSLGADVRCAGTATTGCKWKVVK